MEVGDGGMEEVAEGRRGEDRAHGGVCESLRVDRMLI